MIPKMVTVLLWFQCLTHWGRVTHICVGKLTIIGSHNGLSPDRRQAIMWTNAVILLIGPLGTNFSEILIEIQTFSLKKIRLKMSSAKCCSFHLGPNALTPSCCVYSGHHDDLHGSPPQPLSSHDTHHLPSSYRRHGFPRSAPPSTSGGGQLLPHNLWWLWP